MLLLMIAFCSGVIILYCDGSLLVRSAYIIGLFCSFFVVRRKIYGLRALVPEMIFVALALILGFLYAFTAIKHNFDHVLPETAESNETVLNGYFCSAARYYERYVRADFCLFDSDSITDSQTTALHLAQVNQLSNPPEKIRLFWSRELSGLSPLGGYEISARLKRPKSSHNFTGFSYEKYLFYQGIHALGNVKSFRRLSAGDIEAHGLSLQERLMMMLTVWRTSYQTYVAELSSEMLDSGIVYALLTGDKSRLSDREYRLLKESGTLHLVAISGLHVGIVMMAALLLFRSLRQSIIWVIGLGFVYIVLVGFSESAQRAWVMASFAILVWTGRFYLSKVSVYFLAMSLVLLFEPLAPLNSGFWYSFVAVAILLVYISAIDGRSSGQFARDHLLFNLVQLQLVLAIGLFVTNSLLGVPIGTSSILANLFAVPWVTLVIMPLSIVYLLVSIVYEPLFLLLEFGLSLSLQILVEYLAALAQVNTWFNQVVNVQWVAAFLVICVFLALLRPFKRHAAVLSFVCVMIMLSPLKSQTNDELVVFDAGQGLAIAMFWEDQFWLYDVGIQRGRFSVVDSTLIPYIEQAQASESFLGLVISHGDEDHAGGLSKLFQRYEPERIWSGEPRRLGLSASTQCVGGMSWQEGEGAIEVLYPFERQRDEASSANNRSCVVRFKYKGHTFLLMGDLEGKAEKALVARLKHQLKADVLIAGHHGSKNASSLTLLKHVRPKYFVVSSGYMNRFGHPHPEVIKRAEAVGARVLKTSDMGAVRFRMGEEVDDELTLETSRSQTEAPWLGSSAWFRDDVRKL